MDAIVNLSCISAQQGINGDYSDDTLVTLESRKEQCTQEINDILERYGFTIQITNNFDLEPLDK